MNSRRKNSDAEDVEELLRVAEDEVLLKLSLNSHLKSDRAIDTDLDNRFKSLKSGSSKPKSNPKPKRNQSSSSSSSSSSSEVLPNLPPPPTVTGNFDGDNETPDVDSLLARFNALKATLPSNSVSSASAIAGNRTEKNRISEEDEVEKVIKWAIDAARLDPSPCSDEDEDEEGDSHSDDDDDTDDEEDFRKVKHKAGKKK